MSEEELGTWTGCKDGCECGYDGTHHTCKCVNCGQVWPNPEHHDHMGGEQPAQGEPRCETPNADIVAKSPTGYTPHTCQELRPNESVPYSDGMCLACAIEKADIERALNEGPPNSTCICGNNRSRKCPIHEAASPSGMSADQFDKVSSGRPPSLVRSDESGCCREAADVLASTALPANDFAREILIKYGRCKLLRPSVINKLAQKIEAFSAQQNRELREERDALKLQVEQKPTLHDQNVLIAQLNKRAERAEAALVEARKLMEEILPVLEMDYPSWSVTDKVRSLLDLKEKPVSQEPKK